MVDNIYKEQQLSIPAEEAIKILNTLQEHVLCYDRDMKILWANSAALDSVEISLEKLKKKRCWSVWAQRETPCDDCPVILSMETNSLHCIEKATPDGRSWFIKGYPLKDKHGNVIGGIETTLDITDRKEAEENLKIAFDILNRSPAVGFMRENAEGWPVIFVTPNVSELFGYTSDEFISGKISYEKVVYPEDLSRVMEEVRTFSSDKGRKEFQHKPYRILSKNGEVKWILDRTTIDRNNDGDILYYKGIIENITNRIKTDQVIKESEEKYGNLFYRSNDAIFIHDLDGNILDANQKVFELFGYTKSEVLSIKIPMLHPTEALEKSKQAFEAIIREGFFSSEIEFKKKSGEVFSAEISSSIFEIGGKKVIQGIVRDITDRKQSEEALRESEEKFKSLGENAPDIIYTLARDGSLTYVNPAWEAILGYEREEVLGKYFVVFVRQEEARDYVRIFKDIRDKGETRKDVDLTIVHKDGSTRLFSASGAPNINKAGEVTGMVGLLKDITDHRRLEAQFQQAQRMEALGTLGGGVAHDFNNLLMGIQGRASLMLMDVDSSHPHFEHLKGIEDYVKSAADLTKQLLGFARGGKYEVKPTAINELINRSSRMFGRTKKEIKIHRKYQRDVWTLEADQGQIEQVLMNLYVNAWQAMPGGGDLYVQTKNVSLDENYVKPFEIEPGRYVKISVTDTGVGMDKGTQQRIFDPFFTTKEMDRGTGLGLASAYGIIKNHGGFINVYSEKGEGTTFNIYLPASEKEIIEEKKLSEGVLRGSETILLVDDEDMIIDIGEQLLEKMGYTAVIARNGKEAIDIYEKNKDKIDIVILDMIMPDMSGGDTFDRMREIKSDVKVLLSSGYSISGQATEILERGCDGFIHKPFNMKQLSRKLREILDKE